MPTISDSRLGRLALPGTLLLLLGLALPGVAHSQSVSISGYVKAENIFDSRQVAQVRGGQFHLYPSADSEESATSNFVFAAFQSRLRVTASGADALGGSVRGVVESDFFGTSNAHVGHLRLRHAFVQIDWDRSSLLLGKYWSPLFTAAVYPGTVAFATGAPFQPFARFNQVRFTLNRGSVRVISAATQQSDAFSEIGGAKLQQQAGIPAGHLHLQYLGESVLLGAGGYSKFVRPQLTADRFQAQAVQAYARLSRGLGALSLKATIGDDLTDHLMTGGFLQDAEGRVSTLRVATAWMDATYGYAEEWTFGAFAGYLTNLGVSGSWDSLAADTNGDGSPNWSLAAVRGDTIHRVWRVSPRIQFQEGPLRLAFEAEWTYAFYADAKDADLRPSSDSGHGVSNLRAHAAAYYFF